MSSPAGSSTPSSPTPTPDGRSGTLVDRGVSRRDHVHAGAWTVDGSSKVTGEVDAGTVEVRGTLSVGGAFRAQTVTSRGRLETSAAVRVTGSLATEGGFRTAGPVSAHEASLEGTTRVTADVAVEATLTVRGQFAAASVHAGELHGEGSFSIPGEVRAGALDVRVRGESRFGTIRARTVRLLHARPDPVEMVLGRSVPTPVARIEADRAELEGVDVDFLHCPEVILGRDAHVTELEGTVVRRHPSATVGPRSKSPPPYGLMR